MKHRDRFALCLWLLASGARAENYAPLPPDDGMVMDGMSIEAHIRSLDEEAVRRLGSEIEQWRARGYGTRENMESRYCSTCLAGLPDQKNCQASPKIKR